MLSQIAHLLIQTAFGLLVYTLLLRFYMQVLRAPFRNPVGQLVTALTNWIVLPARRVIPGLMGIDLATFLLARSEEHTSELQSLTNLVCRLLLEKKKKKIKSS